MYCLLETSCAHSLLSFTLQLSLRSSGVFQKARRTARGGEEGRKARTHAHRGPPGLCIRAKFGGTGMDGYVPGRRLKFSGIGRYVPVPDPILSGIG